MNLCCTSNKITTMYKFVGGLFDTKTREGILKFIHLPVAMRHVSCPHSKTEIHNLISNML